MHTQSAVLDEIGVDAIASHFQPIVTIDDGEVVAFEALTRGVSGGQPVAPVDLFREAYDRGLADLLDELCLASATSSAKLQGLNGPFSLFVNVEPNTLTSGAFDPLDSDTRLVVEVTERALTADPGRLLAVIDEIRALGHVIAIDDLGAQPASLALLPLIRPEVVKLDMALVRQKPNRESARIMTAVASYAERENAIVIAEGVETERHRQSARALGATLAQGWLFGRPTAEVGDANGVRVVPQTQPLARNRTPFDIISERATPRRANRGLLVEVSRYLEERAEPSGDSAIVLATFQGASNITKLTRARYESLADHGCFLTVFASDGPPCLSERIAVQPIHPSDPLNQEWTVILLSSDFSAALSARELDPSQHETGDYSFALTTDRELIAHAASALLTR